MKAFANLMWSVTGVLLLGVFAAALGGVWTDHSGRVDDVAWHLWVTAILLFLLTIVCGFVAAIAESEVKDR